MDFAARISYNTDFVFSFLAIVRWLITIELKTNIDIMFTERWASTQNFTSLKQVYLKSINWLSWKSNCECLNNGQISIFWEYWPGYQYSLRVKKFESLTGKLCIFLQLLNAYTVYFWCYKKLEIPFYIDWNIAIRFSWLCLLLDAPKTDKVCCFPRWQSFAVKNCLGSSLIGRSTPCSNIKLLPSWSISSGKISESAEQVRYTIKTSRCSNCLLWLGLPLNCTLYHHMIHCSIS